MVKRKKLLVWLLSILTVTVILFSACAVYVSDFYSADEEAVSAFKQGFSVNATVLDSGDIAYIPQNAHTGIIFYPGGKVEHTAYEPLMLALAEKGFACVLIKMPFNLAVLDVSAANHYFEKYPFITSWFLAGHSLGGSMAASFACNNAEKLSGIILLGSYSTADLTKTDLSVLSIYGENDKVLNKEKYDKYFPNLPENATEFVIHGGNHAYFGFYGLQKGDGTATITPREQISATADKIEEFINKR
ncbi:MAG: lysophospholipase [Clostridia bacterium]|nr:lysophospholipase [Clostridia bacterium]